MSTNVRFHIGIFSRTKLEVNCRVADFIVKPRTWTLQSGYHKMFRYIKHFWAIFSQDWPISNLQKIRSSQGWRQSSAKDLCKGRIPLHVSHYAILLLWYGYFVLSIYSNDIYDMLLYLLKKLIMSHEATCTMRVFLYTMFVIFIYPTLQESSFLCLTMASWKRWYGKFWTRWDAKRSSILWTNASASMRLE